MAKFLNKKEQVFDLQLTTYGKYLMSIGKMQPMYYAFFDDNILYDSQYAFTSSGVPSGRHEPQNEIHGRIKNDTQYFEGLVQFSDIDNLEDQIEPGTDLYFVDVTPTQQVPKLDTFVYEKYIGDAYMDNNKSNYAPAWKIVTLQNKLSASTESNDRLLSRIPQIDMTLYYTKKIKNSPGSNPGDLNSLRQFTNRTPTFSDGNFISLETDDALMYIEELNTILLNENFDVEVFQQTETATIGSFASARLRVIHDVGALAIKNDDTIKFNRNGYTVTFTFKSSTSSATHIELASPADGTCQGYWDALVQTLFNLGTKLNTDTGDGETYAQKLDFYVNFDGSVYESPCGTSAESPSILFEARTLGRGGNDGSVDLYTIAFGLRNVTDTLAALKDARRVLKPGGKLICMEFSSVRNESLRTFYEAYSFGVIPLMGELIAQDERSYQYLVESIRMFPRQVELEEIMREAGFKCVAHENLTGGVVALHSGFRL